MKGDLLQGVGKCEVDERERGWRGEGCEGSKVLEGLRWDTQFVAMFRSDPDKLQPFLQPLSCNPHVYTRAIPVMCIYLCTRVQKCASTYVHACKRATCTGIVVIAQPYWKLVLKCSTALKSCVEGT